MIPRTVLLLSTSLLLATTSGCIVNVDRVDDTCPAEYPTVTGNYAGAIRAASTISYSSDRSSTLETIAAKPDLDEPSQIMLINSLRGSWGYSSDKGKVLQTLVTNPVLTPRASLHVANHLEKIVSYSSDRKRIADLLANRPVGAEKTPG